ncbi:group II intron reverse transcriptase/maturase [soil metagenome]
MLEEILDRRNIEKALVAVERNKGACGVDGMQSDELRPFLNTHYQCLRSGILTGHYEPKPVRKVVIPKAQAGVRMLGIPSVVDRMLQQAIQQWLSPQLEGEFDKNSYGFRPNRNAQMAVQAAKRFLEEGNTWIVELDLEKFFDTVNHQKLMNLLRERIKDKRTLKLIHLYLKSGIMEGGIVSQRTEGTPQGSPLSPLLSNILLDKLDKELNRRGHKFVRYADDCSIYVKSEKSATRVMESIKAYIEETLLLKVNKEKSRMSRPHQCYLLGFCFYKYRGEYQIRVAPKSLQRIREKCKLITKSSNPAKEEIKLQKLDLVIRGWVNYFKIAKAKSKMIALDEMIRIRLRISAWRRWKRIRTKIENLVKLGVPKRKAYQWGNSSKGACRLAHSPVLSTTLNVLYWRKLGYKGFFNYYHWQTDAPTLQF